MANQKMTIFLNLAQVTELDIMLNKPKMLLSKAKTYSSNHISMHI